MLSEYAATKGSHYKRLFLEDVVGGYLFLFPKQTENKKKMLEMNFKRKNIWLVTILNTKF